MIHIIRTNNNKFEVVTVAKNGELLNRTGQFFERRAGCYKNIRASMDEWGKEQKEFQDDTTKTPAMYRLYKTGKPVKLRMPPKPVYKMKRK